MQGRGCQGRHFAPEIGIAKRAARNARRFQPGQHVAELPQGRYAAQHQVRMLNRWGQEKACRFQTRMTGLNRLIERLQITPHKSVQIGGVAIFGGDLRETRHGTLLKKG